MDLELLNYFITKLDFIIVGSELRVNLPACDEDQDKKCVFTLSSNCEQILAFFGYDTTVKLNHLTERAFFNYLVSNGKFKHIQYIKPAKNAQHQRFAKFLKSQYPETLDPPTETIKQLKDAAIAHFEKKREFQVYEYQSKMLQKAIQIRDKLEADKTTFARFIKLHGMNTVIKVGDDELYHRWGLFRNANWSSLDFFS